jgi:hypothetical protein
MKIILQSAMLMLIPALICADETLTLPSPAMQEALIRYVVTTYQDALPLCIGVNDPQGKFQVEGIDRILVDPNSDVINAGRKFISNSGTLNEKVLDLKPLSNCLTNYHSTPNDASIRKYSLPSTQVFVIVGMKKLSDEDAQIHGHFYGNGGAAFRLYHLSMEPIGWKVTSDQVVWNFCG